MLRTTKNVATGIKIKTPTAVMTASGVGNPAPNPNAKAKFLTASTGFIDSRKLALSGAPERKWSNNTSIATAKMAPSAEFFMNTPAIIFV